MRERDIKSVATRKANRSYIAWNKDKKLTDEHKANLRGKRPNAKIKNKFGKGHIPWNKGKLISKETIGKNIL